jgi:hypothetical protein
VQAPTFTGVSARRLFPVEQRAAVFARRAAARRQAAPQRAPRGTARNDNSFSQAVAHKAADDNVARYAHEATFDCHSNERRGSSHMKKLLIGASLVVLMSLPSMAQDPTLPKTSPAPAAQPETPAAPDVKSEAPTAPTAPAPQAEAPAAPTPQAEAPTPTPPAPQAEAPTDKMVGEQTANASSYSGQISATQLLNASIKNVANETVGDINDINFGGDGKIAAVIVGVGGFLGMGEKNVSLPFDQLTFSQDDKGNLVVTSTATKESLQAAPEWKKPEVRS